MWGDAELVTTAISNLVGNAIAYSDGGTRVGVMVRRGRAGVIDVSVTDQGLGIAPDEQQRIFERFYRVDTARSRATGGTGLGLAIVKHVADNHGGNVSVWSEPGPRVDVHDRAAGGPRVRRHRARRGHRRARRARRGQRAR